MRPSRLDHASSGRPSRRSHPAGAAGLQKVQYSRIVSIAGSQASNAVAGKTVYESMHSRTSGLGIIAGQRCSLGQIRPIVPLFVNTAADEPRTSCRRSCRVRPSAAWFGGCGDAQGFTTDRAGVGGCSCDYRGWCWWVACRSAPPAEPVVLALSAPTGPYPVGVTEVRMVDSGRIDPWHPDRPVSVLPRVVVRRERVGPGGPSRWSRPPPQPLRQRPAAVDAGSGGGGAGLGAT